MARRDLNLLSTWASCRRCERAEKRLGVYAPVWPSTTRVVVIAMSATTDVQAAQVNSLMVERLMGLIRERVGLGADEIVGDVLVSCGLGDQPSPDSVAACCERFRQHDDAGVRPALIIIVGRRAAAIASRAGLLQGTNWSPCGASVPIPYVVMDPEKADGELRKIAEILGTSPTYEPSLRELPRHILHVQAQDLLGVLGKHKGRGIRNRGSRSWARSRRGPLTLDLVRDHLNGAHWVAPFDPIGPWPYAVLDLDRHDALQARFFSDTFAVVRRHFPNSLFVTSSDSGGVHVYVRLPPGTRYYTAARWLRVFVTGLGIRWCGVAGQDGRRLVSEVVEVPNHPPRLPFGLGSSIYGSSQDLDQDLSAFIDYCARPSAEDYEAARARAEAMLDFVPKGPSSSLSHLVWFGKKELAAAEAGSRSLSQEDPWARHLRHLPDHLAAVAATGIPSFGTRHRWTNDLIAWLADFVPRAEVERLVMVWLRGRNHVSRDVSADLGEVERQTMEGIDEHFRRLRGVPRRVWEIIERRVEDQHGQALSLAVQSRGRPRHHRRPRDPARVSTKFLKLTAFFIARGFFSTGTRRRTVGEREFTRFGNTRWAGDIEKILTGGPVHWIEMTSGHVQGVAAREYLLAGDLWPAYPHDELLVLPPIDVPRRVR